MPLGDRAAQSGNGAFHIGDLLSMDISDAELDALFAKWRQDIDTAPFRHARQLATTVRQWACRQRYLALVSEVIDRLHGPFRWSRHNGRYGNINNR